MLFQSTWSRRRETAIIKVRKRQSKFIGHIMGESELEYFITIGMIEGKRSPRQIMKKKKINGLMKWNEERIPIQLLINTIDNNGKA